MVGAATLGPEDDPETDCETDVPFGPVPPLIVSMIVVRMIFRSTGAGRETAEPAAGNWLTSSANTTRNAATLNRSTLSRSEPPRARRRLDTFGMSEPTGLAGPLRSPASAGCGTSLGSVATIITTAVATLAAAVAATRTCGHRARAAAGGRTPVRAGPRGEGTTRRS